MDGRADNAHNEPGGMVLSCRHCYEEDWDANVAAKDQGSGAGMQQHAAAAAPSYMSTLVYGSTGPRELQETVQAIERLEQGVLPGITVW